MFKDLDYISEDYPKTELIKTFTVTTVDRRKTFINGYDIKDIFGKIDGLRLEGKRWLETYDFYEEVIHKIFVNIDHIVSIE